MRPESPTVKAALALLGLPAGADRAAVTRAYRRLALATHPDRSDVADAAAQFDALTAAYRRALAAAPSRAAEQATAPTATPTPPVRASATLFAAAGGPQQVIVAGPGRVDPLPTHRRR